MSVFLDEKTGNGISMEDIQKVIQKLEDGIKKEASQLQKGQKRQKKNSERIGLTKKTM